VDAGDFIGSTDTKTYLFRALGIHFVNYTFMGEEQIAPVTL
jgi:hypothetical protein